MNDWAGLPASLRILFTVLGTVAGINAALAVLVIARTVLAL